VADTPEPVYGTASVCLWNALALTPAEVNALPAPAAAGLLAALGRINGTGE
jgi:hypothetical protein